MIQALIPATASAVFRFISTGWFTVPLISLHRIAGLAVCAAFVGGLLVAALLAPAAAQEEGVGPASTSGRVTGYPIPRFVSLKSGQVNMRHGPGESYAIDWIFQRRGMPVEVIAEHDNWRRVRDHEGAEGWIHFQLLDGRRMALVSGGPVSLYRRQDTATSGVAAIADPGVILRLHNCGAKWCRAEVSGYKGWVTRDNLWGVYSGEEFD